MENRTTTFIAFIAIFALSGFSGLIYESIWSHYLKLFLGHASYAQVLVLVIFMGGMAIGSAIAARVSFRIKNLILWYGITEGIIGLFGITFHELFTIVQATAFNDIIPQLGSSWSVHSIKWLLASLIILPQSMLLGATFPLLSAGIIRRFSGDAGKTLATLYFVNSFGASIGILCNAFFLIPAVGLPGAVLSAGVINILLAVAVYLLSKNDYYPQRKSETLSVNSKVHPVGGYLFAVASLTGLASFMYELGWIRMLTMVLGGSTHSFEIMLSAFIFGLAIGGLWIRQRIQDLHNPLLTLGYIQLAMGFLAALTIPLYNQTYEIMGFVMDSLSKNDSGYLLFTILGFVISSLVMLPATICAGTTLPLVTYQLLRSGSGDSAIGKVYAWNTIGSIIGVILTIQIVMPYFGLKWVILGGAFVDILLGIYIFYVARESFSKPKLKMVMLSSCLFILVTFPLTALDTQKMASSVFRTGIDEANNETVIFHKDGKTSTIAVVELSKNSRSILSNGKSDASIILRDSDNPDKKVATSPDQSTMVLLGTLPYIYKPNAQRIANIGLGSGLSAHTMLQHSGLDRLDTIEIEQAVFEAASLFRPNVDNLFTDSRSHVIVEDAKTYFAASGITYDVIVSEPPNPWVSGVSGLFSIEFYAEIKRYLKTDGVLVQWMHLYEITPELVATVYVALQSNFIDIHLYQISGGDVAIVASNSELQPDYGSPFEEDMLRAELAMINVLNAHDIEFRKLAEKQKLDIFFAPLNSNPNSDYFPILDIGAAKARFKRSNALSLYQLRTSRTINEITHEAQPPVEGVTADPAIKQISRAKQTVEFYELWNQYMSDEIPKFVSTTAQRHAKSVAEVLRDCSPNSLKETAKRVASGLFIDSTLWAYDFLHENGQKHIFETAQKCDAIFTQEASLWVNVHLAWFNKDYARVLELTNNYFENIASLASQHQEQLAILNIASGIVSGNNKGLENYYKKLAPGLLTNPELSGLMLLAEKVMGSEVMGSRVMGSE